MLRSLAIRISAAETSLTCVTPPGTPSTSPALIGLHRVDDQQGRLDRLDVAEHGAEVGLGGEVELVLDAADAVGAQPHLGGRLLAGDVQHAVAQRRRPRRHLEQQRGLADARLAGQQDGRARHQTRRRARGRARGRRWRGPGSPRSAPARSGGPARSPDRPAPGSAGRRAPRRCPRPGTHRSGRPTSPVSQPHSWQR